ncbi:hypothetical protein M5K25_017705 [Dendrobium thyrsiflorum]|uniref:Uncharacterized protein n=1 Tax=Dendrobium thyrsiflorum TaxID=117978 RepID=A0ABD0UMZ7_DENTH
MANPERDFGIVYDDQGFIQILQSLFFDVDPEVDHTVNDYIDRILETVVLDVEDQLGTVEWRLAADPKKEMRQRATIVYTFPTCMSLIIVIEDNNFDRSDVKQTIYTSLINGEMGGLTKKIKKSFNFVLHCCTVINARQLFFERPFKTITGCLDTGFMQGLSRIYAKSCQTGFRELLNLTASKILRFPLFAVNPRLTKSGSSADLWDLAEEARERKKDGYLRNDQAPVVVVTSDPTEERRGGVTSDPTGRNVVEGGEEVI